MGGGTRDRDGLAGGRVIPLQLQNARAEREGGNEGEANRGDHADKDRAERHDALLV